MSELPRGWGEDEAWNICELVQSGGTPKEGFIDEPGVPFLKVYNIVDQKIDFEYRPQFINVDIHRSSMAKSQAYPGDVLMNIVGPPLGKVAVIPDSFPTWNVNQALTIFRPSEAVTSEWLYYFLCGGNSVKSVINETRGSAGQVNISLSQCRAFKLPLPPLAEQKRIVAKLDALNAKSARARIELARIETLVSRYKQAVLSKAFSGELVAPQAEKGTPISDLVRQERRSLLAGQRTRNTKGATPNPDRKPVEISGPPKTWYVAPLEDLCDPTRLIQYGILMPGPDVEGGIPYVKVMNIKGGFIELEKIRRTTLEIHQSYARSALKQGDLLLTIRGTVGRVAITPADLDGGNITQDTVRIAVLNSINPRYIYWYLQSRNVQQYFEANKKGVAVQGINVGDVRPMEIPVAPLEEQHEIVRRIESAFAKIDQLAKEAKRALELVGRLDEAILAKAFRGELVPQDENDEPAEHLLARIRAERAAAPKGKRGRAAKG